MDIEERNASRTEKIGIYLAFIMKGLIVIYTIYSLIIGYYVMVIWGLFAIFLTLNPMIITRKLRVTLPWELNLMMVLSFYIHITGSVTGWYDIFHPFYDKIAHVISSITIAVMGFIASVIIDQYTSIKMNRYMIAFLVVIFTMAIGAFWEISEFWYDTLFNGHMQMGLDDTMYDLMFDFIGGLIIAIFGYFYLENIPEDRFMKDVIRTEIIRDSE